MCRHFFRGLLWRQALQNSATPHNTCPLILRGALDSFHEQVKKIQRRRRYNGVRSEVKAGLGLLHAIVTSIKVIPTPMPSQIPFEGDDEATTLASTTAAPLVVKRGPISSNVAVLNASVDSAGSRTGTEVRMERNELTGSGSLTFSSGNQYVGSVKQGVRSLCVTCLFPIKNTGTPNRPRISEPVSEQSTSLPCRYDGGRRHVHLGQQWCSL